MATYLAIDDALLAEAKLHAARSGRSLTSVVEEALHEALARRNAPAPRRPLRLPTVRGSGLLPGVDLDDSAALLDRIGD